MDIWLVWSEVEVPIRLEEVEYVEVEVIRILESKGEKFISHVLCVLEERKRELEELGQEEKLEIRDLRRVFFESRFYRILWYSMSSRR
ncbi:unnamed protein product [Trifolium pratense]|uniref:Uncharacterized protein n=1 Tax=Trifolium pratense TaxID=57577 RepID=A0ACB0KQ82_TRIPR|nr:unnamed protein product [Trifolium pratense]